jgi:hypothetical protein
MDWTLEPGDRIVRKDLQAQFGGRPQGGIGPSSRSPNIMLFTDPTTGHQHGYFDGWNAEDGTYSYYGEGQVGDQRMISGNAAVLRHVEEGRSLRLFQGSRGEVEYLGEWAVDEKQPFYETEAPDREGQTRKVIVFKLRPVGDFKIPAQTSMSDADQTSVEVVPVEEQYTEAAFVDPSHEPYEAERREAKLVRALRDHLVMHGHDVGRLKIIPEGEAKPLFADLFDKTYNALVEAKGSVSREAIRMALGQLLDYGRFQPSATRIILVPERPRQDLLDLADSASIRVMWPSRNGYDGFSLIQAP